jgi:hypothetical protein
MRIMKRIYDDNFNAEDAQFYKLCLLSNAQAEISANPKCYDCKDPPPPNPTTNHMPWNGDKSVGG